MTTAYVWVWIPNPPPSSPEEPPAGSALSGVRSKTYQWTDEEGTTFWTNRIEKVPEPYRVRTRGPAEAVKPQ